MTDVPAYYYYYNFLLVLYITEISSVRFKLVIFGGTLYHLLFATELVQLQRYNTTKKVVLGEVRIFQNKPSRELPHVTRQMTRDLVTLQSMPQLVSHLGLKWYRTASRNEFLSRLWKERLVAPSIFPFIGGGTETL